MKEIIELYNSYLVKFPKLRQEEFVTILAEGLGDYRGKPNSLATKLHPLGRMGAALGIFKNGELIFLTKNASTLPDIPMDPSGRFNSGSKTPTVCVGIYSLFTKLHGSKRIKAFELERRGESVPVIRNSKDYIEYKSISSGINLHNRSVNDSDKWAWSTGCQTVEKEDFDKIVNILGCYKNGRYVEGVYVGKIIIDRSRIPEVLQKRYQQRYGKYYLDCFNTEDISTWARDAWDKFRVNGVNDGKGAKNIVTEEQLMVFFNRMEHYLVKKYNLEKLL